MELTTVIINLLPFLKIFTDNFSLADFISTIFILIIFLVFLYSVIYFFVIRIRTIKKNFFHVLEILKNYTTNTIVQNFENLNSSLSKDPFIGHFWSKFTETLIRKNEGEIRIYSSVDADYFFNENNLVFSKINFQLCSAIPGILTGLGILGTFFGLIFGLSHINLNTSDVEELKHGIIQLLSGTQISFSTSVWGILFSIIFLIIKNLCLNGLSIKVNELQSKIRELFIYKTPEVFLDDILEENQQQTAELKKFNEDLAINIAEALEEKLDTRLSPVFEKFSEKLVEFTNLTISHLTEIIKENQQQTSEIQKFNAEIAINIAEALEEKLETRLTPFLGEISDKLLGFTNFTSSQLFNVVKESRRQTIALEKFNEELPYSIATSINEELNQSFTPLFEKLSDKIEQFTSIGTTEITKAITSGAETGIEKLNTTLNEIAEQLQNVGLKTKEMQNDIIEKFDYFMDNLNKYQENLTSKFNENIERLTLNIENVLITQQEQIKKVTIELENKLSGFIEKIKNETLAVTRKMQESTKIIADYFNEVIEKAVEKYRKEDEYIQNLLTQLKEATKHLEETMLSAGLTAEAFEKSAKPIKESSERVLQAIDDIKKSHDNFIQTFTNIKNTIEQQSDNIKEASNKIIITLEHIQNTWRVYEEKFGEISEELASIFDQLKEGLKEYNIITGKNVSSILSKFDSQLREAISHLAGFVEGLREVVEEMNENLEKIYKRT